jgi:hypothetical protein
MGNQVEQVTTKIANPYTVRFAASPANAKGNTPTHRWMIVMVDPLFKNTLLEGAIFKTDGKYSVSMPGGRFGALKPAKLTLEHNGTVYTLSDDDPRGKDQIDHITGQIFTAFHAYLTTGKADQTITA